MIEIVSSNNLDEILPLIKSYQEFYNAVPISLAHNKHFFSQFNEESSAVLPRYILPSTQM
jgi:hypothetical protein